MRGFEDFNVALLSKWKWRLLNDKKVIWFEILRARYGNLKNSIMTVDLCALKGPISTWWKDLLSLRRSAGKKDYCFAVNVSFFVGNVSSTPFWFADWCGPPLFSRLPLLFNASSLKSEFVCNLGAWINESWVLGDLGIKPEQRDILTVSLSELQILLERQCLLKDKIDAVLWT